VVDVQDEKEAGAYSIYISTCK